MFVESACVCFHSIPVVVRGEAHGSKVWRSEVVLAVEDSGVQQFPMFVSETVLSPLCHHFLHDPAIFMHVCTIVDRRIYMVHVTPYSRVPGSHSRLILLSRSPWRPRLPSELNVERVTIFDILSFIG